MSHHTCWTLMLVDSEPMQVFNVRHVVAQPLEHDVRFCRDENDHGWPATRVALQLQLFSALWPLSDRRHPVATPLALLLAAYLALCTPAAPRHVATGLLLAGLATRAAAAALRLMPEPLTFAVRVVAGSAAGGAVPSVEWRLARASESCLHAQSFSDGNSYATFAPFTFS